MYTRTKCKIEFISFILMIKTWKGVKAKLEEKVTFSLGGRVCFPDARILRIHFVVTYASYS